MCGPNDTTSVVLYFMLLHYVVNTCKTYFMHLIQVMLCS